MAGDNEQASFANTRNLLTEWREDYRLAKLRDQTGVEPKSETLKPEASPTPAPKLKPRREKTKGIDIPF
jgi:hypothetical protein